MANEYCTLEEACELLDKSEQQVRSLVADGKLHELRDGGKVFYKKDELKRLAAKEGSSIVDLEAAEIADLAGTPEADAFASALSSLADESSSLSALDDSPVPDLPKGDVPPAPAKKPAAKPAAQKADESPALDLDAKDFPENLPAAGPSLEAPQPVELSSEIDLVPSTEDSAIGLSPLGGISPDIGLSPAAADAQGEPELEVPDLGLSGSSIISLEPTGDESAGPAAPAKPAAKDAGGKMGISVFDDDELQIAEDPMGETRISSGVEALEAVGTGSGLLDITQESDDTSLGAALLDVISPTEAAETQEEEVEVVDAAATVEESSSMETLAEPEQTFETAGGTVVSPAPAVPRPTVVAATPGMVPINVCIGLGLAACVLVGLTTAGQLQNVWPSFLDPIAKDTIHYSTFGGLAALALILGVFSLVSGRK